MDIVEWDPPHFCRLEKRGRVVRGWAEISVWPIASGSKIVWREVAHVTGVPRIFARRGEGRRDGRCSVACWTG